MKHKALILYLFTFCGSMHAQNLSIQPHPQQVISKETKLPLPSSFQLMGAEKTNPHALKQLQDEQGTFYAIQTFSQLLKTEDGLDINKLY